jgi:hypothetical protein
MTKEKSVETSLVLSTGLLLFYIVLHLKVFLIAAFLIGIIGIFIKPLAVPIAWLWIKLGDLMGYVTSKIILTVIFFILLFPISLLYRILKKDTFGLKNSRSTYWKERQTKFTAKDLENIW